MTNTIHDDISVLRIRIPVIQDEEEEDHTVTPYQDYDSDYEYEYEYDPFDDLDNHYACLEYFELLRQARRQLQTDTEIFDIFSPGGHAVPAMTEGRGCWDRQSLGPLAFSDIFSPIPFVEDYD